MQVSFMSANLVAQQSGYHVTQGWSQGDADTNAWFRPLATFGERFDRLLQEVTAMGFQAMDLWTAHLHYRWATPEHLSTASSLLTKHGLSVTSYAGWFGDNAQEFEAACRVAAAVGAPVLGGTLALDYREQAVALLRAHNLRLGIENHPEKTPAEMLAKIGDGAGGLIGTAVDTGWYATHGFDAAEAIRQLGPHLIHVHLKDILAAGAHDTCRYGLGIVPLQACLAALHESGYTGGLALEHEPYLYDPTEDILTSQELLLDWLNQNEDSHD